MTRKSCVSRKHFSDKTRQMTAIIFDFSFNPNQLRVLFPTENGTVLEKRVHCSFDSCYDIEIGKVEVF